MTTAQINQPLRSVVNVKKLQGASRRLQVVALDPQQGRYLVESASQPGQAYEVTLANDELTGRCTCPWAQHGGINCKHVLAALRVHYAGEGALSFWRTHDDARRQHRHTRTGERMYVTIRRH